MNTDFKKMGLTRKTSWCRSFCLLWVRGQQYSLRNPFALWALFGMSIFVCLIIRSILGGVGNERFITTPFDLDFINHTKRVQMDYLGAVFYVATDQFICLSLG